MLYIETAKVLLCWFVDVRKLLILLGWVFFVFVAYKASMVEIDFKEFDPYAELGIDRVCLKQIVFILIFLAFLSKFFNLFFNFFYVSIKG